MFRADQSWRVLAACTLATCTQTVRIRTDCASDWPTFAAKHSFVSTQRVSQPRTPVKFDDHFDEHAGGPQGLSAFPEERFAFCSIEKNGCSQWDTVLQKIASHDPSAGLNYNVRDTVFSPENLTKVFNDPHAVRAVMVREPLSRFASAYLDKCFELDCTNPFCYARPQSMRGKPISFKDVLSWMLQRDPALLDGHWRSQSEHCELRTRISEYTIIGLMKKETFARDSRCILEAAGLEKFDTTSDGSGEPFFKESLANAEQDEENVLKKLFTPAAARSLIAHLHKDYETFNFPPEPSWVAEATGEWFDYVPPQSCERGGLAPSAFSFTRMANRMAPEEADDIVAMAAMAGFPEA